MAFCNDSVGFITWRHTEKIPDCLGFAVTRIDVESGEREILPGWTSFKGIDDAEKWGPKPTTERPVQKYHWMDFTASFGRTYQYEIVAMVGKPGNLKRLCSVSAVTNAITYSTQYGSVKAAFTRGVLSTQSLANKLPTDVDGLPDFQTLLTAITTPGDPIRTRLAGNALPLLKAPMARAKSEGGHVLQALYELADPELVEMLASDPELFSLILSNTGADDETNAPARERLHKLAADVIDRMIHDLGIGHNKLQVYVNAEGVPMSVTTGSTNWTSTGLCCQSNNVIEVPSPELAAQYADYWQRLKAEGNGQSLEFRAANAVRPPEVVLPDGTRIQAWFAPNTQELVKPRTGAATPVDMADVFEAMRNAKRGIFFGAFYPGSPSIITEIAAIREERPELFIRGVISSYRAIPKGVRLNRRGQLPIVVTATGIEQAFGKWVKELLKLPEAHAIVHDKIVIIDPGTPDCVVIITSHNLGFKASYQNDENMLIVRGNEALAIAYMVHVMDLYFHYRFRGNMRSGRSKFQGYLSDTPDWQDKYLNGLLREEMDYWALLSAAA